MSYIQQVVHVASYTNLPSQGADGVLYVIESYPNSPQNNDKELLVQCFYWDNGYHEVVNPETIVRAKYTNTSYPALDTIKKALDFLLTPTFSVSFLVFPDEVYSPYSVSIQFSWILSKPVDQIASIVIKNAGTDAVIASDLVNYTSGTVGNKAVQTAITADTTFQIIVTDKDGNIITAEDTITYSVNRVTISELTISPDEWHELPLGNTLNITLAWELSHDKEYITDIILSEKTSLNDDWNEGVSILAETESDGTGTISLQRSVTQDIYYKVTVYSISGSPDSREVTFDYIPYEDITYTAEPEVEPNLSDGGITSYSFVASVNKSKDSMAAGSYARLYEVDENGTAIPAGISNVLNNYLSPGKNYVDLWSAFSDNDISKTLQLHITGESYFNMIVCDVDEYGNTSFVESIMTVAYSPAISILSYTHEPTTYYIYESLSDSFTMYLAALFNIPMTQERIDNIEHLQLRIDNGVSVSNIELDTATALTDGSANLSYSETLNTVGSYLFSNAGTYTLGIAFKENDVPEVLSATKTFMAQEKVGIAELTVQKSGSNHVVMVELTKKLESGSTVEVWEKEVVVSPESDYTQVIGTIQKTTVTNDFGVQVTRLTFNTSVVNDDDDAVYGVKVIENLGERGSNATSEAEETYDWVPAAKVLWGVLSETVLNLYGYSIDYGGGELGNPNMYSAKLLSYGVEGTHDLMDKIFSIASHYVWDEDIPEKVESMQATSIGNGYYVAGSNKNYLKFNFQNRFTPLGVSDGYIWCAIPEGEGFPAFEEWYFPTGDPIIFATDGRWHVIGTVDIDGNSYTLYIYRGMVTKDTAAGYQGGAIAQMYNVKFKHNV